MPLSNMIVEARDDESAGSIIFIVKEDAAEEGIGTTCRVDVVCHVEIQVEKASTITFESISGCVGIADEASGMV